MSAWVIFKSSVASDSIVFKLSKEAVYCGTIMKKTFKGGKKISISADLYHL